MTLKQDLKAFIFDLDDTLYPQKEYTRQCLMATTGYIADISDVSADLIKKELNSILDKNGIEYRYIFDDLFKALNFNGESELPNILKLFHSCKPELNLFDNTWNVLTILKQKYRLALLTDGYERVQRYKISQLNLGDFFEEILITFSLGEENRKPATLPYEILLDKMNLKAYECIYVGNDPKRDFIACKKLGMKSLRINQGDYKDLFLGENFDADLSISDIKKIIELIK